MPSTLPFAILVIDDDQGIREMIRLTLELHGYKVYTASSGREGLEFLRDLKDRSLCLILLDLMMPEVNGWEFMNLLGQYQEFKAIPVVIMTAFHAEINKVTSQEVITKPFSIKKLLEIVGKYCNAMSK